MLKEGKRLYLTLSDIQKALDSHLETTGKHLLVSEAACLLYENGLCSRDPAPEPDYTLWDLSNPADLMKMFFTSSLDVTPLVTHPDYYVNSIPLEQLHFFEKDVWPLISLQNEAEHFHSQDCFSLKIVLAGEETLHIKDEIHVLEAGCAALIAPNVPYGTDIQKGTVEFVISIKKSTLNASFAQLFSGDTALSSFFLNCLYGRLQNVLLFYRKPDKDLFFIIRQILTEHASSRSYSREIANSYTAILLGDLFRNYGSTYSYFSEDRTVHVQMPLVLSYIRNNLDTVTLSSLAAFFGYDTDYMGKIIKKSTGKNYKDVLNTYKIEKARSLLLYSDRSVEEIGELCGFSSTNHFTRTFSKYKGATPSKYRKEHSDGPPHLR